MKIPQEKSFISSLLLVSIASFFAFGFFHLAKFETTDEHLWKYGRIKQYWQALENKDWEKTYINDKPGVTVALVSGIGLFSYPDPEANQMLPVEKIFEKYDVEQALGVNFAFRLPILIFATASLFLFFYLASKALGNPWSALIATMLMALNPILVGMSQIINPDSFFWIFGGLSAFAYLALLKTKERKFLYICAVVTGFALLSKYTSFILFLFYALSAFASLVFQKPEDAEKTDWKHISKLILDIAIIFLISILVFSIMLPAVFVDPNYLFKGISQFVSLKNFAALLLVASIIAIFYFYKRNIIGKIIKQISSKRQLLLTLVCTAFSILLLFSFVNVWTGQKMARVDALRDAAYANEPKEFNFKPLLDKNSNTVLKNAELFAMESYPFIFSLSPVLILLVIFTSYKATFKKIADENAALVFSIFSFALLYFASTIFAGIVTNVRYSIVLYPIFAILGSVAIVELANDLKIKKDRFYLIVSVFLFILFVFSLWKIRPFYFSYANSFLPNQFSIHDSWGHGAYEAAKHLNSLPDSENMVVWSNSDTVCRFFKGKCLRNRRIDLAAVSPDYFVISKRGELKLSNRFILVNNPKAEKDSDYYFEKLRNDFVWQLLIDNRPDNYIKIVEFEK